MGQVLFRSSPESKHLDGFFPSGLKGIWLGRGSLRTGLFAAKQTFFAPAKFGQKKKQGEKIDLEEPFLPVSHFFAAAQSVAVKRTFSPVDSC